MCRLTTRAIIGVHPRARHAIRPIAMPSPGSSRNTGPTVRAAMQMTTSRARAGTPPSSRTRIVAAVTGLMRATGVIENLWSPLRLARDAQDPREAMTMLADQRGIRSRWVTSRPALRHARLDHSAGLSTRQFRAVRRSGRRVRHSEPRPGAGRSRAAWRRGEGVGAVQLPVALCDALSCLAGD